MRTQHLPSGKPCWDKNLAAAAVEDLLDHQVGNMGGRQKILIGCSQRGFPRLYERSSSPHWMNNGSLNALAVFVAVAKLLNQGFDGVS